MKETQTSNSEKTFVKKIIYGGHVSLYFNGIENKFLLMLF